MPYMPKQLAPIKCMRHSLPYYCPACFPHICSRNQKTDEGLIAVKNQCLSFSIFTMTMNAGLLHLNTRVGIIHVEEIRHGTKSSSVRKLGLNISELVENKCLRHIFSFPLLPFLSSKAELLSWRYTLRQSFLILVMAQSGSLRIYQRLAKNSNELYCFPNLNRVFGYLVS